MEKSKRDNKIDVLKGILTVLMIVAHIFQFFSTNLLLDKFGKYVNLTTFSGFMFCFGYVCYIAYADSSKKHNDKEFY